MKHKFQIGTNPNTTYAVDEFHVLAVYGIVKLPATGSNSTHRVDAIKLLRMVTGLGLFEAKNIVEYIADNGALNDSGRVELVRRSTISYIGTD